MVVVGFELADVMFLSKVKIYGNKMSREAVLQHELLALFMYVCLFPSIMRSVELQPIEIDTKVHYA
jgi:hypothetical protein